MTRRALLIGCQTLGLQGCNADVSLMNDVLIARGFDAVEIRRDSDASRAGLLDAFDALAAAIRPADAVVVYFSGHGGRVGRPDYEARARVGQSVFYQFLVPSDMEASADGQFRGLLSEEITAVQRRLTQAFLNQGATPNVTTILDCCFAGYLARDASLRPKSIPDGQIKSFPLDGIRDRADAAEADGPPGSRDTNPYAVRVVATQPEQSAYEREGGRGGVHGVFTEALAYVLNTLDGRPVPWSVIGDLIRRRVQGLAAEQRPEVEGPAALLPFSTERAARTDSLPVAVQHGRPVIEGASLFGLSAGDRFALQAPGGSETIGTAEVTGVDGGVAWLGPVPGSRPGEPGSSGDRWPPLPDGIRAVPVRLNLPKRAVRVSVDGDTGADLVRRLGEAPRLTAADATGQRDPRTAGPAGLPVFATVVEDGGLRVLDELGAPVRTQPRPNDDAGRDAVVDLLDLLARGRALAELPSGTGPSALPDPVEVSFARLRDGERLELARHGTRVCTGELLSLRVRNLSDRELYFWLFDVGVSSRVTLVTNAGPEGTRLGPCGDLDDTRTVWGARGAPVSWPADVPAGGGSAPAERPETFVVIIADRRQDLRPLEASRDAASFGGGPVSALDRALQVARRGVREVPTEDGPDEQPLRYRVEQLSCYVVPAGEPEQAPRSFSPQPL